MNPLDSLQQGHWFKLICGASFQHLPSVRTLTLAYALAGADCIDIAADPAVMRVAQEAIAIAQRLQPRENKRHQPWLMVSINDGDDPHFRKAVFNPNHCPEECPQPCINICPADAITVESLTETGVIGDRCYGCGRCLPICPLQHIQTQSHQADIAALMTAFYEIGIDALEIHSQVGHSKQFEGLWRTLSPILSNLKLLAISCPYEQGVINYLRQLEQMIRPLPCPLLWQTDGRPMSGDIGDGTTRTTIKYAQLALKSGLPGFFQVAGGTNRHTVAKLQSLNLFQSQHHATKALSLSTQSHASPALIALTSPSRISPPQVSGVAYGSYGRSLFDTLQAELDQQHYDSQKLEEVPILLEQAVAIAWSLVQTVKPHIDPPTLKIA